MARAYSRTASAVAAEAHRAHGRGAARPFPRRPGQLRTGGASRGGDVMQQIPDDPIIACMERTGYPPWAQDDDEPDELFAVYDPD